MKNKAIYFGCVVVLSIISIHVSGDCPSMDVTGDCYVDLSDFNEFAGQWLKGTLLPSDLILIPAGAFQMGNSISGEGLSDEQPVHLISLDSFYMGKYEITNGQYCEYLNSEYPSRLKVVDHIVYAVGDSGNSVPYCNLFSSSFVSQIDFSNSTFSVRSKGGRDMSNDPMTYVSWYGAVVYCNWRSQREGQQQCYDLSSWNCDFTKKGYRLPTEAEWEYAARGGIAGTRFPWGDTISHTQANYNSSGSCSYDLSPTSGFHPIWNDGVEPFTSPVGSFSHNYFGLYDMTGNVWEWCNDWYGSYSNSPTSNPTGPVSGSRRDLRGGGWNNDAEPCRVSRRSGGYGSPLHAARYVGFRVVLDLNHPSSLNLIGHWDFDSGYADKVGSHPGIAYGNPMIVGPDWACVGNGAIELGGDDYILMEKYKRITGSTPRTCSCWIKTSATIAPIMYWGDKDTAGGMWEIRVNSGGQLRVQVNGGGINGVSAINTGQWVHVAAVLPEGYDDVDDILLYINGKVESGTVVAGKINTAMKATFRIGTDETSRYFVGMIDDLRLYDRALGPEEILILSENK